MSAVLPAEEFRDRKTEAEAATTTTTTTMGYGNDHDNEIQELQQSLLLQQVL